MKNVLASTGLVTGLVQAVVAVLVAFGVNISQDQLAAIMGVTGALLAVIAAYFHPSVPVGKKG